MQCRQCGEPLKSGSTVTCLKSTCQEAEYHANMARNKPKTRRLKPKEGAKKADGTTWTKVPGGLQKLEIKESPDEVKLRKLRGIAETLLDRTKREQKVIVSFTKSLAEDPARAFESSISSFAAAARLRIYVQAYEAITQDSGPVELYRKKTDGTSFNTLDNLIEYSQKEVNRRSSAPFRSSSPTSNLMEQEYLAAWADVIDIVLWS
jgi:hypothetical protein